MNDNILEETKTSVERIQNFDTGTLSRREELGRDLSFDEAIKPAERLTLLFKQIPLDFLPEITEQNCVHLRDKANSIFSLFNSILKFSAAQDGASSQRTNYIDSIKNIYDNTFNTISPIISYLSSRQRDFAALEQQARAAVQSASDQAALLTERLAVTEQEAVRILSEVRRAAAEQGVSQQASYFRDEADLHDSEAKKWKSYTIYTSVALGIFSIISIFIHKIDYFAPKNAYDTIQLSISKFLLFATIGYMLILFAKNFLSHKHNSVVNRHRQNALLTFNALVNSAHSEDKRDIVLTHAASCIFSPQETGYTKQGAINDGSIKLIEIAPKLAGGGAQG